MHRSSLAPVLSATRSLDSCWIIYFATSSTSARRQFFVFDSGRVSTMRTTSPTLAVLSASWAWNFVERRTTFLYRACAFTVSTRTTIVLSIALETTTPRRSWRRPRSWTGFATRVIGVRPSGFSRFGFERARRSLRGGGFGGRRLLGWSLRSGSLFSRSLLCRSLVSRTLLGWSLLCRSLVSRSLF